MYDPDKCLKVNVGIPQDYSVKMNLGNLSGVVCWSSETSDFREGDIIVYSSDLLDKSIIDRYKIGEITTITSTEIHIENLLSDQEEIYRPGSVEMSRLYRRNDENTATIRRTCGYLTNP